MPNDANNPPPKGILSPGNKADQAKPGSQTTANDSSPIPSHSQAETPTYPVGISQPQAPSNCELPPRPVQGISGPPLAGFVPPGSAHPPQTGQPVGTIPFAQKPRQRPQVRCPTCYKMVNLPATHCPCGTDLRTGYNPELERLEHLANRRSAIKKLSILAVVMAFASWQVWAALSEQGSLFDFISQKLALLMEPAKIEQRVLTEKEKEQAEAAVARAKNFINLSRQLMAPANLTAEERIAWASGGDMAEIRPLPARSFITMYMLSGGPERIATYQGYRRQMLIKMLDEINPDATNEVILFGFTNKLTTQQSRELMAGISKAMADEGVLNAQEAMEATQKTAAATRVRRLQAQQHQTTTPPAAPAQ